MRTGLFDWEWSVGTRAWDPSFAGDGVLRVGPVLASEVELALVHEFNVATVLKPVVSLITGQSAFFSRDASQSGADTHAQATRSCCEIKTQVQRRYDGAEGRAPAKV